MDQRDERTWITLELTKSGEIMAAEGMLEKQLRKDLGVDSEFLIFVPTAFVQTGGRSTVFHLMEGYAFIQSGLDDSTVFGLERLPYISKVMSQPHGPYKTRTVYAIPDAQVQKMRRKLDEAVSSSFHVGATVVINQGPYKNLEGNLIGIDADQAHIRVQLRSLDMVLSVPRMFLRDSSTEGVD